MNRAAPLVDVLVVGGGPAGSVFAREMSLRGHDVCLLDRASFPRPKACGECLNPGAVAALDRLGLLPGVLADDPSPMEGWLIMDGDGPSAQGGFEDHRTLGITRGKFDHTLLSSARDAGVLVNESTRAVDLRRADGEWIVETVKETGESSSICARLVVGADGLRSIVSRRLGLIRRKPKRRKTSVTFRVRGSGPSRSCGRVRISDELTIGLAPVDAAEPLWNCTAVVPAGSAAREFFSGVAESVIQALVQPPFEWDERPEIVDGPWTSGPFDWPTRCMVADGAMLIGDAAGYYDPFTGQGIYRALRSAELAADVAHQALVADDVSRRKLMPYHRAFSRELRVPRFFQRVVDAVLTPPALRNRVIRLMARSRPLADRIVGVAGDVRSVASLVHPSLLLRRGR